MLCIRHDGDYGIGPIAGVELFVVDEAYVVLAGPIMLVDVLSVDRLRSLLPEALFKRCFNDNRIVEPL